MWHGDTVYYLSDAGDSHRLNLFAFDTTSGERRQLTNYTAYDVKWPSIGPGPAGEGEIVFQLGPELQLLNLASGQARRVEITIPGARARLRPLAVDASKLVFDRAVSATGKRVLLEARGDIWTLPAHEGSPRNLNRTAGAAERDPAGSPDGKWIAYFTDQGGEYELAVRSADGRGEARELTDRKEGFLYDPTWSPDSRQIAFWDQSGSLYLVAREGGEVKVLDRDVWARQPPVSWSSDSRFLAYAKGEEHNPNTTAIWVYDRLEGKAHRVTAGRYADSWPTFDREGKYLFFASMKDFTSPVYEDVGTTWVYAGTDRLYVVPLRRDLPSPSHEENVGTEDEERKKRRRRTTTKRTHEEKETP
jgi:tricorn protease